MVGSGFTLLFRLLFFGVIDHIVQALHVQLINLIKLGDLLLFCFLAVLLQEGKGQHNVFFVSASSMVSLFPLTVYSQSKFQVDI